MTVVGALRLALGLGLRTDRGGGGQIFPNGPTADTTAITADTTTVTADSF